MALCVGISPSDEKSCHVCDQAIDDRYLNIHLFVLHPECFRCTSCQVEIKPASLYYLHHQDKGLDQTKLSNHQIHCSTCHTPNTEKEWQIVPQPQQVQYPTKQLTYHPASQPHTPVSSPFDKVQPSDLMGSKKYGTNRPQFGTVKVCPGCTDRITSVHDERTGPRAAKWHRQCLVCCSCQKVLDSSAKVHQDSDTDRLVPSCTTCLVITKKEYESKEE
ncbi:hypothetical protein [Absidia glauca]|uniref:LIM zinc-binding domain-containing protein n=1 Tax=Absidia glauca TaxID=4829 RepID=A0A168T750_ABSGL|nr:hypothetical protein [Absidia glauca]